MVKKQLILLLFLVLLLNACSQQNLIKEEVIEVEQQMYEIIESNYVLERVNDSNVIILDVRTVKEFNEGHIPNSIMVNWREASDETGALKSVEELEELFGSVDKDKEVIVYCRSGRRAGSAAEVMIKDLGFENVKVYKGSMNDWNSKNLTIIS